MRFDIRKFGGLLAVATILGLTLGIKAKPASAHTLDLDGDIAVVLHVNPNDMPTSGTQTSIVLFFNDSTNRFTLPKCNCRVTLLHGTQPIASEQLADTHLTISDDPITFPKPGVYTIAVRGQPKQANAFQPFFVSFNVRVVPSKTTYKAAKKQTTPLFIWIGLGVIMISVVVYAIVQDKRANKHAKDNR